jgi:sphingomyelin phosphodiesterase
MEGYDAFSFAPLEIDEPSLSTKWLYEHVAEIWSEHLPPEVLPTIKNGGYYTVMIRPGLRLIALNNNVCLAFNWWIIYSVKAAAGQFQWMHDVLLSAENAGEKVHILAHVPNGDEDFHQPCSREYRRIIERFRDTIVGQFNGHTEFFEFNIYFENKIRGKPMNVAWSGGSLATYSGVNRNYNLYTVDPQSFVRCRQKDNLITFLIPQLSTARD